MSSSSARSGGGRGASPRASACPGPEAGADPVAALIAALSYCGKLESSGLAVARTAGLPHGCMRASAGIPSAHALAHGCTCGHCCHGRNSTGMGRPDERSEQFNAFVSALAKQLRAFSPGAFDLMWQYLFLELNEKQNSKTPQLLLSTIGRLLNDVPAKASALAAALTAYEEAAKRCSHRGSGGAAVRTGSGSTLSNSSNSGGSSGSSNDNNNNNSGIGNNNSNSSSGGGDDASGDGTSSDTSSSSSGGDVDVRGGSGSYSSSGSSSGSEADSGSNNTERGSGSSSGSSSSSSSSSSGSSGNGTGSNSSGGSFGHTSRGGASTGNGVDVRNPHVRDELARERAVSARYTVTKQRQLSRGEQRLQAALPLQSRVNALEHCIETGLTGNSKSPSLRERTGRFHPMQEALFGMALQSSADATLLMGAAKGLTAAHEKLAAARIKLAAIKGDDPNLCLDVDVHVKTLLSRAHLLVGRIRSNAKLLSIASTDGLKRKGLNATNKSMYTDLAAQLQQLSLIGAASPTPEVVEWARSVPTAQAAAAAPPAGGILSLDVLPTQLGSLIIDTEQHQIDLVLDAHLDLLRTEEELAACLRDVLLALQHVRVITRSLSEQLAVLMAEGDLTAEALVEACAWSGLFASSCPPASAVLEGERLFVLGRADIDTPDKRRCIANGAAYYINVGVKKWKAMQQQLERLAEGVVELQKAGAHVEGFDLARDTQGRLALMRHGPELLSGELTPAAWAAFATYANVPSTMPKRRAQTSSAVEGAAASGAASSAISSSADNNGLDGVGLDGEGGEEEEEGEEEGDGGCDELELEVGDEGGQSPEDEAAPAETMLTALSSVMQAANGAIDEIDIDVIARVQPLGTSSSSADHMFF